MTEHIPEKKPFTCEWLGCPRIHMSDRIRVKSLLRVLDQVKSTLFPMRTTTDDRL